MYICTSLSHCESLQSNTFIIVLILSRLSLILGENVIHPIMLEHYHYVYGTQFAIL